MLVLALAGLVLAAAAAGFVLRARPQAGPAAEDVGLGGLLFRDMKAGNRLAVLRDGRRVVSARQCMRFYAAARTGVCLHDDGGLIPSYSAEILDARLRPVRTLAVAGTPSRARVSPSGNLVAWTMFVTGDSYTGVDFTTRTSVLDLRGGDPVDLETYALRGVARDRDRNIWGVTFADDGTFYATLATRGRTHLVRGDVAARTLTALRENVECPSLSPDGTRLAYKKRVRSIASGSPWEPHVLDLATMTDRPLAERRSVDDQIAWQDDRTLLYAVAREGGSDLWTVPADGTGAPRTVVRDALSPSP
ncbi:PD40 domain-containing protein [Actinocorallia longicatena]|uniref:PD40 domain-containing protein n=1 Tax=Actinocorallia longicatena TaxID=111803 RepID=A0ABP6QU07_9ACTN